MATKKNQREELIHSLIWQSTVIVFILIISWLYTLPKYVTLAESIDKTNALINEFHDIEKEGIPYIKFNDLLSSKGKIELLSIVQSAPIETQNVIKKTWSDLYLTWLNNEIIKSNTDEQKLLIKKARLNSILPTLNPVNNNLTQDTINQKRYVYFVESNIFKKFDIENIMPLGIQSITYGKKGTSMPETIWYFDINMAFETTNGQIMQLIDYVNSLGKYDLLNDTSTSSTGWLPAVMSNPLAMINAFSLEWWFDKDNLDKKNSGNMTIRFYVRGSSKTDIEFLTENLKSRRESLKKNITTKLDACTVELTCPRKKDLELISRKFTEFSKATEWIAHNPWTEVYELAAEIESLIAIETEFKKLIR